MEGRRNLSSGVRFLVGMNPPSAVLACILSLGAWLAPVVLTGAEPEFSTAGFFQVPDSGREAFDFNVGWRFHKGDAAGADARDFDDKGWELVATPHGVDGALPEEASGCANYQGPAWYRKTFTPPDALKGRRVALHFEGILGRSRIWINGKAVRDNTAGFLPVVVDVSGLLEYGRPNVVVVRADNSDDGSFPPGKPQRQLDYAYFGGIYRDVWLIATGPVHITDPNVVDQVAGGGLFVRTESLTDAEAVVAVDADVANTAGMALKGGKVSFELRERGSGRVLARESAPLDVPAQGGGRASARLKVPAPRAWSPDDPVLHDLVATVLAPDGRVLDGLRQRVGLRTVEITHERGLVLNGKPFPGKLIGANRHQDFAVIGFALPNELHWRDARKLRDCGLRVIRSAHYPQDPAFMDACDELGLLVIANIPGWQYWNQAPTFAAGVYSDIRNLVRRDRNHPCVLLWEPILNETHYPDDFARRAHELVHAEYPYAGCHTAADSNAAGAQYFDVLFSHPLNGDRDKEARMGRLAPKPYFTREWGDNVDDWSSHNSPSRVARQWGEVPQLVQARHYAGPAYPYTCWDTLYKTPAHHFGGTLWHSFDHQRGYHPDPFLGGIFDAFRRPKYSAELFRAQRPARAAHPTADSGPMVFIAHGMTPFSPSAVTVYSNCDAVRLTSNGKVVATLEPRRESPGMPSPILEFPNAFDFMAVKALHRANAQDQACLLAEGIVDGKVVATHRVRPAKRASKLRLELDDEGVAPRADGSSIVVLVASLTDGDGNVKRLNNGAVRFEVGGPAELVGDASVGANPRTLRWGEAPALLRSGTRPGKVRVVAHYATPGSQMPQSAVLEFELLPSTRPAIHDEARIPGAARTGGACTAVAPADDKDIQSLRIRLDAAEKELNRLRNREVERQQGAFEQ